MGKLLINGGYKMDGTIKIDKSKNAYLPIIASCVLVRGEIVLQSVPKIRDIHNLLKILSHLNIDIHWSDGDLYIDTRNIKYTDTISEQTKTMRASTLLMGAIYGRFKKSFRANFGGCKIGARPIDMHIAALSDVKRHATEICLDTPSVGVTENVILATATGNSKTKIINAAREPEVVDLCNFLNSCGARICGAGTDTITVFGVKFLHGTTYTAIPDRIIAGSYMILSAACGGDVTLVDVCPEHNKNLISHLVKMGCEISVTRNEISIHRHQKLKSPGIIHTGAYPGFPTDLQPQMAALCMFATGTTILHENMFESRFGYVKELKKLGGKICVTDNTAIIKGITMPKTSSQVALSAADLRGGVALVIGALAFNGTATIEGIEYIERGHANIESDILKMGGNAIYI